MGKRAEGGKRTEGAGKRGEGGRGLPLLGVEVAHTEWEGVG